MGAEAARRRIGILGGTFDPIHNGHLAAAEECRVTLALDLVLFLPAGQPPHKRGRIVSPVEDRVAMVELAIASNAAFRLSRVDVDRPGPSYSVDALALLRAGWGEPVDFWFIMGADSLAEILTWHQPARLLQMTRIAAVNRPDAPPPDPAALEAALPGATARIDVVEIPTLRISSSDLRARARCGRPIKYQTPDAVERYVNDHGLYRGAADGRGPISQNDGPSTTAIGSGPRSTS